jgi:membrane fusion protein, heavy metal efflux system
MRLKEFLGVGTVVLVTIVAGYFILGTEPRPSASVSHGHGHGHGEVTRGDGHHGDHDHGEVSRSNGHHGDHDHGDTTHGDDHHGDHDRKHEEHADHDNHDDSAKGPHGGRLFSDGNFGVEVVIVEDGVPPRFRVYCYEDNKPIAPQQAKVSIELKRLGDRITHYEFEPKGDFLHSDTIVEEPHSFDVKVVADHDGEKHEWKFSQIEARTRIVPEVLDVMGIEVETAEAGRIQSVIELPGEVVLNTDRICRVVPRVSGVVSECTKNLGDRVTAGETVAVIDSRELADAASRYLVRLNQEKLAKITFERTERLWKDNVSPEKEFLDAEQAFREAKIERLAAGQKLRALGLSEKDLREMAENPEDSMTDYALKAPFDGVVINKQISQGEWVEEKADLMRIADLSTVWVDITIYADYLDSVRVGQKATVRSDSTDLTTTGVVSYVGPLVGEKSRTAKARIVISNTHGRWRPGMFVTVKVVKEETVVPVAVRPEAIQTLERFGDAVFVRYGEQFEVRPITIGRADSEYVEVLKGLSQGEKYASTKSFLIKAELAKGGLSHTH